MGVCIYRFNGFVANSVFAKLADSWSDLPDSSSFLLLLDGIVSCRTTCIKPFIIARIL